jgi:hypothetical protein
MATSCFNVNDPGYQALLSAYNGNNILVDSLITSYQKAGNGDAIPSPEQVSEMLKNMYVEKAIDPVKVSYYQTVADQSTSQAQRDAVISVLEFTEKTDFDPTSHTYVDRQTGQILKSTTTAIKGSSKIDNYLLNREIGNLADRMLEGIITGKRLTDVSLDYFDEQGNKKTLEVSTETLNDIWSEMEAVVRTHLEMGSVLIPQVVVQNVEAGIAGSIDVLVVKRNGSMQVLDLKTSKTSVKEKNNNGKISYYHTAYDLENDSILVEKGLASKLTKHQQHILQVNVYTRMLEAAGFKVTEAYTHRYKVDINETETGINGIVDEGRSENMYYEESMLADAIIAEKTHYSGNPVGQALFEEADTEKSLPQKRAQLLIENSIIKPLTMRLKNLSDIYRERVNLRDDNNRLFVPKAEDTINKLQDLLFVIEKEGKSGRAILAYSRFLRYATEDMQKIIDFLSNKENVESERAAGIITNASNFLETYSDIQRASGELRPELPLEQQKLYDKMVLALNEALAVVHAAKEQHVKYIIKTGTSQKLTDEEIDQALKEAETISGVDAAIGDLDTSTDVLLRIIAKRFKRQLLTAQDNSRAFNKRADEASADLIRLSPGRVVDYGFMYEVDAKGDLVVVDPYSTAYYEMEDNSRKDLYDADGKWINYYEIKDPLSADPKHIQHNKELFEKREAYNRFRKAEIIENGAFKDGEYHKYNDEFKAARSRFEYFNGRSWVKRPQVSDSQYRVFRNKYYEVHHDVTLPVRSGKGYTGVATTRTIEVPKRKYAEPRLDARDPSGKSFTNAKYSILLNPRTDLERAQSKFYNFYVNEMQKGVMAKLPDDVQERYKHRVPSYNDYSEQFAHIPTVPLRAIVRMLYSLKDFFFDWNLPISAVRRTKIDEKGRPVSTLPLFMTGTFDDNVQEKINKINNELSTLKEDLLSKKISFTEYEKLLKDLKEERARLNRRPQKNIVSRDVLKSMKIFHNQVSIYEQKMAAEDTFLMLKEAATNRTYYTRKKFNSLTGKPAFENVTSTESSATVKRLEKWFKQIYYEENYFEDLSGMSKIGSLALKKIVSASSLVYVGYNVWGNAANLAFGGVANHIEGFAGVHFSAKGLAHARKLLYTDYFPNKIQKTMSGFNANLELVDDQPGSKTEALIRYFNMPRHLISEDERGNANQIPGSYFFQDGGEFLIQSSTGLAMLAKIKLVNEENGSQTSALDAYDWDPDARTLKLKDGDWYIINDYGGGTGEKVKYDDDQKRVVQNYIYEVNKQIHGNYAAEDRVAIQDNAIGAAAMQFHKWVYPSFKAHFKGRYFDENLGWYEGRVISLIKFMAALKTFGGNSSEAWASLEKDQKANIGKVGAQLVFFTSTFMIGNLIASLKDLGDDEDDDDALFTFRRSFNGLSFLNDKVGNDLAFFLNPADFLTLSENPIASFKYGSQFVEAFWRTMQFSYYGIVQSNQELLENKEVYYQTGTRAGQLKLAKEWGDVIPALYTINRWKGFDTVDSDYTGN